jgi:energy-coupling factor transporter ATP-binding protein EcfA2
VDTATRLAHANQIFTPGFPVRQKDLFAGRSSQLSRAVETLSAPGRHPIIFGKRGVGKTSLANILSQMLQGIVTVKISCDGADSFTTIWNRVFTSSSVRYTAQAPGFANNLNEKIQSLGSYVGHQPGETKPAEVAASLSRMQQYCVVIFDEFDKVQNPDVHTGFADLIKILSDSSPQITICIVGVAENIRELIGQHPSIDRNLVHVELPIMSDIEISEIISTGFRKLEIEMAAYVSDQIPQLAWGFPHYADLLGLSSVRACVDSDTSRLSDGVFKAACDLALQDAIEKYRDSFAAATATTQASRYPVVLSACGFAATDIRGVFRATDDVDAVREVF